jgi:hypothetical protein
MRAIRYFLIIMIAFSFYGCTCSEGKIETALAWKEKYEKLEKKYEDLEKKYEDLNKDYQKAIKELKKHKRDFLRMYE